MSNIVGHAQVVLDLDSTGIAGEARRAGDQIQDGVKAGMAGTGESIEREIESGFREANTHVGRFQKLLNRAGTIAFGNLVARGVQGLARLTSSLVQMGIETRGVLDGAERGFKALSDGSQEAADKWIAAIKKMAVQTPFELPNLAETTRRILAVSDAIGLTGKTLDETRDNVLGFTTVLGDLVATFGGDQTQFDNAVLAVSQMGSQGKIAAQEMRQLNDALPGFNAWRQLAAGMGISEEQLRKMVKSGEVLSKDALPILLQRMKEFPGAAGAMSRAAGTISGVLTNLKDLIGVTMADALQPFTDALVTMFTPETGTHVQALTDAFTGLGDVLGSLFIAVVPIIGPMLDLLARVLPVIGVAARVLGAIIGPIAAIAFAITNAVIDRLRFWGETIGGWFELLSPVRDVVTELLEKALKPLGLWADENSDGIKIAADALIDFALAFTAIKLALAGISAVGSVLTIVGGVIGAIPALIAAAPFIAIIAAVAALGAAAVVAYNKFQWFRDLVDAVATWFVDTWDGVFKWFEENWDDIQRIASEVWGRVVGAVQVATTFIKTAINAVKIAWGIAWTAMKTAAQPIIDFFVGLWRQYGDEITGIITGIIDIFVAAWDRIFGVLQPIVEWFVGQLPGAIEFFRNVVEIVWPLIEAIFKNGLEQIQMAFQIFLDVIGPLWDGFWNTAKTIVEGTYNAIRTIVEGLLQFIQGIINIIAGILEGDWGRIWDGVVKAVEGAWNTLRGVLMQIITFFQTIWAGLKAIITKPFEAAWDVIEDIWGTAKQWFSNIIDGIKGVWNSFARSFNDIRIPSVTIGGIDLPGPIPDIPSFTIGPWDFPNLPTFAMGAVFTQPTLGVFGESGPEVIIPLSKPARAQQLLAQTGLASTTPTSVIQIDTATFVTPTDLDLLFQKAEAAMVLTGAI